MTNYGYKDPVIKPEDYVLGDGNLAGEVIMPDGHGWGAFLPNAEVQAQYGIDPYACTNYSINNAIEILLKRKFGGYYDYSERFSAIGSGTDPLKGGNDINTVAEFHRKNGFLNELDLPFDSKINTLEKFYFPKPLTNDLVLKGKKWMDKLLLKHEWVYPFSFNEIPTETLKIALRQSPLVVGVYAWVKEGDLYVRKGSDTHATVLYDYEDGKRWMIYDSYPDGTSVLKDLAWDFKFFAAKKYTILNNEIPADQLPGILALWNRIQDMFHSLFGRWKK